MKKRTTKKLICISLCAATILSSAVSVSAAASKTPMFKSSEIKLLTEIKDSKDGESDYIIYENPAKTAASSSKKSPYASGSAYLPDKYSLSYSLRTSTKDQGQLGLCWAYSFCSALETSAIKRSELGTGYYAINEDINLSERQIAWCRYFGNDGSADKSLYAGNDHLYQNRAFFNIYDENGKKIGNSYDRDGSKAYLDVGGNTYQAVNVVNRGYGASKEDDDRLKITSALYPDNGKYFAYNHVYLVDEVKKRSDIRVNEYKVLNTPNYFQDKSKDKTNFSNYLNEVKSELYNQKGVVLSYNSCGGNKQYWNGYGVKANNSIPKLFYRPADGKEDKIKKGGHAVHVIGYDDTIKASQFQITVDGKKYQPEGDGAWLIKNSWGTNSKTVSSQGYFYLSYYDRGINQFRSVEAEDTYFKGKDTVHEFKNIYQYSGAGIGDRQRSSKPVVKAANVFTARSNEEISALQFDVQKSNATVDYTIRKYKDNTNPDKGAVLEHGTVHYNNIGIYTIKMANPISISKGEKVAVEYYIKNSDYCPYQIPFETKKADTATVIDVTPNVSYIFKDGAWTKIVEKLAIFENSTDTIGNATVKMLTNPKYVLGDVNFDGKVNTADYNIELNLCLYPIMSSAQKARADINKDGRITKADVTALTKLSNYNK